jgi:TonB family protein
MGLDLRSGRPEDRLVTAVFVAALLHGLLIMGLRFTAPPPDRRPLPALEVLLVPEGPIELDNESAAYLSSRDQRGAGTARDRQRTSLPEASASLLEHSGEPQGTEPSPAASDDPVLEVAIRADGSLQQVTVRRSSGRRELDNAAIRSVRLASPFDPFPPAMRERFPVLRFAYEWQFMTGRASVGTARPDTP